MNIYLKTVNVISSLIDQLLAIKLRNFIEALK